MVTEGIGFDVFVEEGYQWIKKDLQHFGMFSPFVWPIVPFSRVLNWEGGSVLILTQTSLPGAWTIARSLYSKFVDL